MALLRLDFQSTDKKKIFFPKYFWQKEGRSCSPALQSCSRSDSFPLIIAVHKVSISISWCCKLKWMGSDGLRLATGRSIFLWAFTDATWLGWMSHFPSPIIWEELFCPSRHFWGYKWKLLFSPKQRGYVCIQMYKISLQISPSETAGLQAALNSLQ